MSALAYRSSLADDDTLRLAVATLLQETIAAAPWPPPFVEMAMVLLSEPRRVLGGHLTRWATLPLVCCAALCGEWQPALPAAAAAELCSVATDLLDDLEDGDASAAIERYGAPVALNAATALLMLMSRGLTVPPSAAGQQADAVLREGLLTAMGGQHLDLTTAGGAPLDVEACLEIARRKSGALIAACSVAGAVYAHPTADQLLLVRALGTALGVMGQLDNDMHDAEGDARKTDLARQKQTVPIALARQWGPTTALDKAVWEGGIQMTYALMHAERARATEAIEALAASCPHPADAHRLLDRLLGDTNAVDAP